MEEKIKLKHNDYETIITPKQLELETDIQERIHEACIIGREKNIIFNNYEIIKTIILGKDLKLNFIFNNEISR